MLRWNNDYNHGAHPAILDAFARTNDESYGGYGIDEWCSRAADMIKAQLGGVEADVHFMVGGTQVNYTVIAAALRPYQSVISADCGHINTHETGAVENTGHKIEAVPAVDGKLTAAGVRAKAEAFRISGVQEHITQPKFVFLSNPSEFGTVYSMQELREIRAVCDEYGLYLYMDGARLGYGLAATGLTLADIASVVDAFYIGGTKCGAMLGEAVVLIHNDLKEHFRSYMKQNGGMLAKGWVLGLQFATLFENGLYFAITKQAVEQALRIKQAFAQKGVPLYLDSITNQQFVVLSNEQMAQLGAKHIYEYQEQVDETHHCVRFCTSWSTKPEDVDVLIADIKAL